MTAMMKALVKRHAEKGIWMEQVPVPEAGPNEVLIKLEKTAICGTDLHIYKWDEWSQRTIKPGLVIGHEFVGRIAAIGPGVTGYQLGDRVSAEGHIVCGHCRNCRAGRQHLCPNTVGIGVNRHGAFAEFVTVPARIVHVLPDALGFNEAAMIEAVSVGVHAVRLTPCAPGDTAVIVGTGMIGLLTLQAAKIAGFAQVIAVDTEDSRLDVACELGATHRFNPKSGGDLTEFVKSLTKGQGADAAFECVGLNATVLSAIHAVRKGGTVTLVGNLTPKTELPLQVVVTRQLRLQGSCASAGEIPRCIELLATKQIKVDKIISAVVPLEQGADWFAKLYAGAPGVMKVILAPQN